MSAPEFVIRDDLLERLAVTGPRYTSYPTAPEWSDAVGESEALAAYRDAAERHRSPIAVYVHVPFCERLCLYCACTVHIAQTRATADRYLDAVEREARLVADLLAPRRRVTQLHWGGGTPTFLTPAQLERLHRALASTLEIDPGAEQSIEVDPHVTRAEHVDALAALGFNRLSLGVQDLDPAVQEIVQRRQTEDETVRLVERCRARGIDHLNVDLMYGLPGQTLEGFGRTLDLIADLSPDRVAVFGYAHVPWIKPSQRVLERSGVPGPQARARLFALALDRLGKAGYVVIGLDHFAKPGDSLVRALHAGTLHRNFMGYATLSAPDLIGLGMSAIGDVAGCFLQNARDTAAYEARLGAGRLATVRGLRRSEEDELRRAVILSLMCRMRLDLDELEAQTGRTDLASHFAFEWRELEAFAAEGLCDVKPGRVTVTATGRLFLRHLAMVFDAYLRTSRPAATRFSQAV